MTKILVSQHKIGVSRLKECGNIYFYVVTNDVLPCKESQNTVML